MIKQIVKSFIPPIFQKIFNSLRKNSISFKGVYTSWDEAMNHSTGYESELILNKVKNALLKVKSGEAAYERDSVLFDKIDYPFPLLSALLRIAVAKNGNLSILDFGGSLGTSYYQCRSFLSCLKALRWSIVEQDKFVTCGKEFFEDDELKFYYSIDECLQHEKPDVILLSGVIQCIKEPYLLLENILKFEFDTIILDRTPCTDSYDDILTVEIVPPSIYDASYPFWIFNTNKLLNVFMNRYSLLAEFSAIDGVMKHKKTNIQFKGFIFEKK